MFGVESMCNQIKSLVSSIEAELDLDATNSNSSPRIEDIKSVLETTQLVNSLNDRVVNAYSKSGIWAADGYLSGKAAIVHETGQARRSVEVSLARGNFLARFPIAREAIESNAITTDHISSLLPLAEEKYIEFLVDDIDLLIQNATNLSSAQFSNVTRHWKNMVNAIIEEPTDEYKAFENRKLFLHELLDGSWFIHGELDPITGKILDKALGAISQKLYNSSDENSRVNYTATQQRADAIGYLAERYIEDSDISSTPLLNTDIVINLDALNPETTTHAFLKKVVDGDTPIVRAHSPKYFEQLLCDSSLQIPVRKQDGSFDLGRKVRTAPWRMKKQLMLNSESCSVPGCCTPSKWCDAHHIKHWIHGGETKIENLALLCRRHHTMVHNDKTFEEKLSSWLHKESGNVKHSYSP